MRYVMNEGAQTQDSRTHTTASSRNRNRLRPHAFLGIVLFCLIGCEDVWAQSQPFPTSADKVQVQVIPGQGTVRPGTELPVAVIFEHLPGWHTNPNKLDIPPELGDASSFVATAVEVDATEISILKPHLAYLQWPEPKTMNVTFTGTPVPFKVFSGRTVAYLPVTVATDAPPGPATLTLNVTYQACDDRQCLFPVRGQPVTLSVEISENEIDTAALSHLQTELFESFPVEVWESIRFDDFPSGNVRFDLFGLAFTLNVTDWTGIILLFMAAGVGGLLLNFTPCVLPVIPIKIMSLAKAVDNTPKRMFALGLSTCAGIVAFWLALGVAVSLFSQLTATNQLFQYPVFTIGVGAFIIFMALGMGGLFSIRLPQAIYRINPNADSLMGSFVLGIMTAILSTPCTAPFMGAALGWSTQQHAAIALTTFTCIGMGMAAPYFALSIRPKWARSLAGAGPATVLVKQLMGLLLLAVGVYFIGSGVSGMSAHPNHRPSRIFWWPVMLLVAAAGGWLAFRTFKLTTSPRRRFGFAGLGILVLITATWLAMKMTERGPIDWVYYTADRFERAVLDRKVVIMDFTAEWCLNCKALEESVLHNERIVRQLSIDDVVPMKVDLTGANEPGKEMLVKQDRLTIPLLVVFDRSGHPVFKSDFYTVEQLDDAIELALGSSASPKLAEEPSRLGQTSEEATIVEATHHWPQWRGPLGTGVSPSANPPLEWSERKNIRWKIELPGKGHSSPVVWGDRIYLTTAIAEGEAAPPSAGRRPGDHDNFPEVRRQRLVVLAINRRDGGIAWQRTVREAPPHEGGHLTGSYASASPVTDGKCVIAFFGSHGLYALDTDGKILWHKDLGEMWTKHGHGEGSSPALHGDKVVVNWDHEGPSFIAGFDKDTGVERWRRDRDEPTSWATPIIVEHDGGRQVVVSGTNRIRAYDLESGEQIWECGGMANNVVATPVAGYGLVFAGSSYEKQALLAVRLQGAKGDVTGTGQVAWRTIKRTPYVPSPLLFRQHLYFLRHYEGMLTRLEARTGKEVEEPVRLPLRAIYASPVAAAGRLYVTGLDGSTVVLGTGVPTEVLARNYLDDRFSASAALAGSEIFLRGARFLYCISDELVR